MIQADSQNQRFTSMEYCSYRDYFNTECRFWDQDYMNMHFDGTNNDTEETTLILEQGISIRHESNVYLVEKILGAGGYGEVAKCRNVETEETVAIKVIRNPNQGETETEVSTLEVLNNLGSHNNVLRYIESFNYKDCFCIVVELLDLDLFDFLEKTRSGRPLRVCEIRPIAQQMLVALSALKSIDIIHADIKPDNIMLVDHISQPLRGKLIDFGLAYETSELTVFDMIQVINYRAPEIHLGLPRDEGVDMFSLGCTLAYLFLSRHLFPAINDYEAMRIIVQLLGQPDKKTLDEGWRVKRFFTLDHRGSEPSWRLKTPDEYERDLGVSIDLCEPVFDDFGSLNDFLTMVAEKENPDEFKDLKSFIDLLKKMLAVNPADRILPADALQHPFITMEHLPDTSSSLYVTEAHQILAESKVTNPKSVSEEESHHSDIELKESRNELKESRNEIKTSTLKSERGISIRHDSNVYLVEKIQEDRRMIQADSQNQRFMEYCSYTDCLNTERTFWDQDYMNMYFDGTNNDTEETTLKLEQGVTIIDESIIYHVEDILGSGSYGEVVKCRKEATNEIVAVKIFRKENHLSAIKEINAYNYLSTFESHNHILISLIDSFLYKDCYCLVFELLDRNLFGLLEAQSWTPLRVAEIRPIAKQLLVTLSALKDIGITHADIKPDNVMLVDHQSKPFEVKLIDFGFCCETSELSDFAVLQAEGYRAPEVYLGLPSDEGIDMWGLGCTLAFLFLGQHLCPNTEYQVMKMIVTCFGPPDNNSFDKGWRVRHFFTLDQSGPEPFWRFKTPEEYELETGGMIMPLNPLHTHVQSLEDFVTIAGDIEDPTEIEDIKAFVDLLKKMLAVNPANRILPDDALKHRFITMEPIPDATNRPYENKKKKKRRK